MGRYDIEILELENKLKTLKDLKEKELKLCPHDQQICELADIIHTVTCKSNHTDHCDWYDDKGDWSCYSRKKAISMATKIADISNISDAIAIISLLED